MNRRLWTIWLVAAALALRSLVAPGMMLSAPGAAGGLFKVEICSEYGIKVVTLDANGQPVEEEGNRSDGGHCFYGPPPLATFAADIVPPAAPVAFVRLTVPARTAALHANAPQRRHARAPHAIS